MVGLIVGILLLVLAFVLVIRATRASVLKKHKLYGGVNTRKLPTRKQVAQADDLLSDIKVRFEAGPRSKDPQVHFMCVKATGISQVQLWLSLVNHSDEKIVVERVEWELWFGNLVKFTSRKMDLLLNPGQSAEDLSFDEGILVDEVKKLAELVNDKSAKCFVDGKIFCRTKVGFFEKQFSMFNLSHVTTGLSLAKQAEGIDAKYEKDQLTGLFQRYYIEDNLQKMMDVTLPDRPFSFMMIDMDDFKNINDTYGHLVGDEAIKLVCKHIESVIESNGVAIRYGGDEFCVLLQAIEKDEAESMGNKIIKLVSEDHVPSDPDKRDVEKVKVSLSIGVSTATEKMEYNRLIKKADDMLYQAKKAGKNQVKVDRRGD